MVQRSEFVTPGQTGAGTTLVLKVAFADNGVNSSVRQGSILELVQRVAIPKALKDGFSSFTLWDETGLNMSAAKSISVSSANRSEPPFHHYDFEQAENWVWEQTGGPMLNLGDYDAPATYRYDDVLNIYTTDLMPETVQDRRYFRIWMYAEGADPQQAAKKADELYRSVSGCANNTNDAAKSDSFLGRENAIALVVYVSAGKYVSPLQVQPYLKLNYGHKDGVLMCSSHSDLSHGSWDDVFEGMKH